MLLDVLPVLPFFRKRLVLKKKPIVKILKVHEDLDKDKKCWWKDAVIYQIYVPSFKDTNCDGYGDLRGIIDKLDYFVELGVNILWLSPIFDSPMYDMGYDIADYCKVNPAYGNLDDVDDLLEQAHKRNLRVIFDIALNHTSIEHAWFKNSVAAHKGEQGVEAFKDFYIWGDPIVDEDGIKRPPSNWSSVFEGCMWELVPEISKYYLHVFGKAQPDLNWENPNVRKELWKVLRFWLARGVDGFRLDAINCTSKVHNEDLCEIRPGTPTPSGWPDALITDPDKFEQKANEMFANGPKIHEYLHEMHEEVFAHYDAMTLGEMSCGITPELGPSFVSREPAKKQLDLIVHFDHVELDCVNGDKWIPRVWKLPELKSAVTAWQTRMAETGGWDTIWMENHDQPRGVSRFCPAAKNKHDEAGKLLALWLFTLKGTVIMFQGQELGMTNPEVFSEDMIKDIETRIFWNRVHAQNQGEDKGGSHKLEMAKKAIATKGRDASRIPFPWDGTKETAGGFTDGDAKPWLPTHPNFPQLCAASQRRDPTSIWAFYRDMIRLRQEHKALVYGSYNIVDADHPSVFAYTRTYGDDTYLVVLNFKEDYVEWVVPVAYRKMWSVVISSFGRQYGHEKLGARLGLERFNGIVYARNAAMHGQRLHT